jgi:hypothetical protein
MGTAWAGRGAIDSIGGAQRSGTTLCKRCLPILLMPRTCRGTYPCDLMASYKRANRKETRYYYATNQEFLRSIAIAPNAISPISLKARRRNQPRAERAKLRGFDTKPRRCFRTPFARPAPGSRDITASFGTAKGSRRGGLAITVGGHRFHWQEDPRSYRPSCETRDKVSAGALRGGGHQAERDTCPTCSQDWPPAIA